jgi:hypothetical protein
VPVENDELLPAVWAVTGSTILSIVADTPTTIADKTISIPILFIVT